jgi:hypothetical protein
MIQKKMISSIITGGAVCASLFMATPLLSQTSGAKSMAMESQGEFLTLNQEQIREMQNMLKQKGFDIGKPDGLMGPKTREALLQFQRSEGLTTSGKVDQETMQALKQNRENSGQVGQTGTSEATGTEKGATGTDAETYGTGTDWTTGNEATRSEPIEQQMREQPIEQESLEPKSLDPSRGDQDKDPDKVWMHQQQQ